MVLLHSEKKPEGVMAFPFTLRSVDNHQYRLEDFPQKALLIMFICNHCPYVQAVEDRIIQLRKFFAEDALGMLGICSNDPTDYPDDAPANLKKRWVEKKYGFPYLIDTTQEVAKQYGVVCTPEFFLYDKHRKLVYHGQLDDNWKEPSQVKNHDLQNAITAVLNNQNPSKVQHPSMGCSIKWKK